MHPGRKFAEYDRGAYDGSTAMGKENGHDGDKVRAADRGTLE